MYVHTSGDSEEEVGDQMQAYVEKGFHHIRVQISTPGYSTYGNKSAKTGNQTTNNKDPLKGPIPITSRIKSYDKNKLLNFFVIFQNFLLHKHVANFPDEINL